MHEQNKQKAKQKSWWETKFEIRNIVLWRFLIYICDLIPLALKGLCARLWHGVPSLLP